MALKGKDIEALWNQYSEDGVKRGISVTQFFESNGVPYRSFEKWYKMKFSQAGVADCVLSVSGDGSQVFDSGTSESNTGKQGDVLISYVTIGMSNGLKIEHHSLSYVDLVCFINKLQPLCSV
jgi:hypothetical protein